MGSDRGKEGFPCSSKGCCVSRGDEQPSGALGASAAGVLEAKDPHATSVGAQYSAQAPEEPWLHLSLNHLSCPWFLRVGDRC